ncbi:2'-5' RNA ligase family protein [Denitratisoma sp. agr-D3]
MRADAADAWQTFLRGGVTQANVHRDFPEWHRGRPHYGVWVIVPEDEVLTARLDDARERLVGLLLPDYRRQAHVTLHVCGFPAPLRRHDDDFLPGQFHAQIAALKALALAPFTLMVGGLSSFATAPFLAVADPTNSLTALRGALAQGGTEVRDEGYEPHVTIGLYDGTHTLEPVVAARRHWAAKPALALPVRRIAFMVYASTEIGGPLSPVAEYDLAENLLKPLASTSFAYLWEAP